MDLNELMELESRLLFCEIFLARFCSTLLRESEYGWAGVARWDAVTLPLAPKGGGWDCWAIEGAGTLNRVCSLEMRMTKGGAGSDEWI